MDNKRIIEILINLSCDMDYLDYADTLEEIKELTNILDAVQNFQDLKPLYALLEQIAAVNEHTRDFVNEKRSL